MLTKYHSRKAKKIQGLSLKKYKKMEENNIEKSKEDRKRENDCKMYS